MSSLFVAGKPAPQGSKRHVGNGRMIESSKYVGPWRKQIAAEARRHYAGQPPLTGPISMHLMFVMPRPASTPKTKPTPPAIKRPDGDKLARAVLDAVTGILFADDSQVTDLRARKRIAEPNEAPGVHISYAEDVSLRSVQQAANADPLKPYRDMLEPKRQARLKALLDTPVVAAA